MKYPYWIVVGDKEVADNKVTLKVGVEKSLI